MSYGGKATAGLFAYIVLAEAFAPSREQLISAAFDRLMQRKSGKILCWAWVILTGGHMLNLWPPRYDIYHIPFHGKECLECVISAR